MTQYRIATSSLSSLAAFVVSVLLLLLPPVSYGLVAYLNVVAQMDRELELDSRAVNVVIATAPQLWAYQEIRFTELLTRQSQLERGRIAILDDKGGLVVAVGPPPAAPVLTRKTPLFDAGLVVGQLESTRSLRELLLNSALLFVLGMALASAAYVTLRVIPLRALQRANDDLRRRDAELAFANVLLTATSEGSPDGMLVVDANGRIVTYNQRFVAMWAISAALVEAREDGPVLASVTSRTKDPDGFAAQIKYLYEHPEQAGQDRIDLKDGRVFDRHTTTLYDPERKYLGRVWFFRDVTEREAMAEAIRVSEEKFRSLVEATTDFIWAIDATGQYTYASPAIRGLLGFEPEEVVGKTPYDFMPPGEAGRVASLFAHVMADRVPFSMLESRVLRKDGGEIVVETSGVPVFDGAGVFCGYRGIDRDITKRKVAEQQLQRRDALLHAVATSAAELAAAASLDDAIPEAMKLIGETMQVDGAAVLEAPRTAGGPMLQQYGWTRPEASASDSEYLLSNVFESPDAQALMEPLREGQPVIVDVTTASGNLKKMFETLGVKSLLLVPILVDGKNWGQIGLSSREAHRQWQTFEIEVLTTFTDLIGNAIQRERYVKELRDAMRIVQDTPTILYRLSRGPAMAVSYISQNIKLYGYDPEAFTTSPSLLMTIIHPDDVAKVREALAVAVEGDSRPGVVEHRVLTSRGVYRWVENRYTPVRDAKGRLVEIEGILMDITDRLAAEEKITLLARTDALTGLANRATFVERLRLAFAAARRGALPFAVLYLDLDHFKDINDSFGHPTGDQLLKAVADRLRDNTRANDLVARPGGDEFAILQSDLTDGADAGALAVKLRAALAVPIPLEGSELHITASIGIATYAPDIPEPDDMLARADLALYRAKDEGRDQYRFHSLELDERVREQVTMADQLREALVRQEFELHYQPQVELSSGRIVGMEALLRWNHPTRGRLKPMAFLGIADRAGSIAAIGNWVLGHACSQLSDWRKAGIAPPTIAVNVALAQLKTGNEFVQLVESTLAKYGLPAGTLEIDVTESMLAHTTLAHNDVLERLQKLGVKIAIDDFGTKFSSLDYLRTYRVGRLKISKSMVEAATEHTGNAAMVRAITSIARELNIEVVAQGVESEAQWSFLTATTPSTKVQGYFYSMPVPADQAADLLRQGTIKPSAGLQFVPA